MDLRHFKKVADHDDHAVFKSPHGHEIKVSKKGLDPKLHKQLKELPLHMDEGGEVKAPVDESQAYRDNFKKDFTGALDRFVPGLSQGLSNLSANVNINPFNSFKEAAPAEQVSMAQSKAGSMDPNLQATPQPAMADMPQQVPPQGSMQVGDPFGANAYTQAATSGMGLQMQGIQDLAKAEGASANAQARVLQEQQANLQKQEQDYKAHYNQIDNELASVVQDMNKGHIDPNAFWNSRSSGQKAAIYIGLALGGNPQILKDAIDRDVNAQVKNLDQKNTVFAAQMKRMGNVKDAADMTRLIQASVYAAKLNQAAMQAQSPVVKAKAEQAMGALMSQYAPLASQLAMRRSMQTASQGNQMDPSMMIRMMVPEGQQKQAYEDLAASQALVKGKDAIIGAFKKAAELNTIKGRTMKPIQAGKQIDALIEPAIAKLSKDTAGRFTEQDADMLRSLKPGFFDNAETVQVKLGKLAQMLEEKNNFPLLRGYGIQTGSGRFDNSGQSKLKLGAPVR